MAQENLVPSATLVIKSKARQMRAEGIDVIGFAAGEPDFDTPIASRGGDPGHREGFTKYTASGGINELKDAVVTKLKRDNGLTYARNQVLISCGGKRSLYNFFRRSWIRGTRSSCRLPMGELPGAGEALRRGSLVCRHGGAGKGFGCTEGWWSGWWGPPRARILVLNSPSNPTGRRPDPERTGRAGRPGARARILDPGGRDFTRNRWSMTAIST